MTLQDEFTTTTRKAQEAWVQAARSWTQTVQSAADQSRQSFAPVPFVDPARVVDQWFDFADEVLQANRQYAKNLAGVASVFGGAVREHVGSLGEAVRDQVDATTGTVQDQAEKAEQVARDEAERVEQAEKEAARQARAAERARVREQRQAARERYEGKTKAELAEELSNRDLPKTGNVDELIERLVDADTQ